MSAIFVTTQGRSTKTFMSDHTRHYYFSKLETSKAICVGKAKSHPLQSHVDSVRYFDKDREKEVSATKPESVACYKRKNLLQADGSHRKAWVPVNQSALDVFAAFTKEERDAFMYAEPPQRHVQECESQAILNGSKIKALPHGKKDHEFFPLERGFAAPRGKSSLPTIAVEDEPVMTPEQKKAFDAYLSKQYST